MTTTIEYHYNIVSMISMRAPTMKTTEAHGNNNNIRVLPLPSRSSRHSVRGAIFRNSVAQWSMNLLWQCGRTRIYYFIIRCVVYSYKRYNFVCDFTRGVTNTLSRETRREKINTIILFHRYYNKRRYTTIMREHFIVFTIENAHVTLSNFYVHIF